MIADQRLNALTNLVAKERTRPALCYVCVKDGKAVATDGHLIAISDFTRWDPNEFPQNIPGEYTTEGVFLDPDQIVNAFKAAPKKPTLPILENVAVTRDKEKHDPIVSSTTIDATASFRLKKQDLEYPHYANCWPRPVPAKDVFTISLGYEPLKKLVDLMKASNHCMPNVILRGTKAERGQGLTFYIDDSDGGIAFKGMIMQTRRDNGVRDAELDYCDPANIPEFPEIELNDKY